MKGYRIIQHPDKFCFGMDAVLLSGFARVYPGGSGCWIWEPAPASYRFCWRPRQRAAGSADWKFSRRAPTWPGGAWSTNGLSDRVEIVEGDIKDASSLFGASSFDVVTCNPPYMGKSAGLVNPMSAKAIARHEILCSLEDVIREAARILPAKGRCYFVHRPFSNGGNLLR